MLTQFLTTTRIALGGLLATFLAGSAAAQSITVIGGDVGGVATPANANANPAATTSTSLIMAGMGGSLSITPVKSGHVQFNLHCSATNSTAPATDTVQLYYGTGTAPAQGTAATGTAILGSGATYQPRSAGQSYSLTLTGTVTTLTVGTTYWFDAGYATGNASDPLTLTSCSGSLNELP